GGGDTSTGQSPTGRPAACATRGAWVKAASLSCPTPTHLRTAHPPSPGTAGEQCERTASTGPGSALPCWTCSPIGSRPHISTTTGTSPTRRPLPEASGAAALLIAIRPLRPGLYVPAAKTA